MSDEVSEFIGVYDADSTLIGEISYWVGARLGRTHCALCELTHGLFTVKGQWRECTRALSVPFRTFHRNDAPDDVINAAAGAYPIVLARRRTGLEVVLDPTRLREFDGSTERFASWLADFTSNRGD